MALPKQILNLSETLSSLPGVGPKLSNRLALYLAVNGKNLAINLANSLNVVAAEVVTCQLCGNVSETEICEICSDEQRDKNILLIVEDSIDLYSIESTGKYTGLYHVLKGVLSPVNGIGPSDINLESLFQRLKEGEFNEVIIGLNPNVEGESTSMYIKNNLEKINPDLKTTRLAKGIPVGGDLEYVSQQTLIDSFNSRSIF